MNIKIIDSWLREYLDTKATVKEIAKYLSLTSVSVDRVEKIKDDSIYDIEVTTNRPDLMSVLGIAKEAATILPEHGIQAKFKSPNYPLIKEGDISFPLEIKNDPTLVNRIQAVVIEVEMKESPDYIKDRLESSGIRSLNNIIDVTNYVMRETGHPAHVFDFDLLTSNKLIIRQSKKGEILITLDNKKFSLYGGDIVADNGKGQIVDLLGVMGTKNSVVKEDTKRILYFLDNNNPVKIRKTSMSLGIRTEAAIINEKGIDPELMDDAFRAGVELYENIANGKVVSKTIDIYPNKPKINTITISNSKISSVIGIQIDAQKSIEILKNLGFIVTKNKDILEVTTPTIRPDVKIEEDVIEEIARIYGYHKLPSIIPTFLNNKTKPYADDYFFEEKTKDLLKYLGFTEIYNYSLVSEDLFDGPIENAVKLKNPLSEDMEFMRNSLVPGLIQALDNNRDRKEIKLFELSNIYIKNKNELPKEKLMLSGILSRKNVSFFEIKGLVEILLKELGIKEIKFKSRSKSPGAQISIKNEDVGYIEILDADTINFELYFDQILKHANNKKAYKKLTKFPSVLEDVTFVLDSTILTEDVINEIMIQSFLVRNVTLKDRYENSRTFHIVYQSEDKNLTKKEVGEIRTQIINRVEEKFDAQVK